MSNAAHRKTDGVTLPKVSAAHVVTGLVQLILAVILALSVIGLDSTPAAAGPVGYLQPAVTAGKIIHPKPHHHPRRHARPFWNGMTPRVWTGREPMCDWRYAYHYGIARDDAGNTFNVQCLPEGTGPAVWDGPWSWSLV